MRTRVHFIAPYESMIPIIEECIPRYPELSIQTDVGDLAKGVELAIQAEKTVQKLLLAAAEPRNLLNRRWPFLSSMCSYLAMT